MTSKICGQCGNIISQFTDKTTHKPCMFRDADGRWNGADRLFDDTACIYYHERWKYPPILNNMYEACTSVQMEFEL